MALVPDERLGSERAQLLWRVFDALRGSVSSDEYTYVLPLLVLKFASDAGALDGFDVFGQICEAKRPDELVSRIDSALLKLEGGAPFLRGVFRAFEFRGHAIERSTLREILDVLRQLDLREPSGKEGTSIFGDALFLLSSTLGKIGFDLQTPSEVAALISQLVEVFPGAKVYDPYCRSGSLLTAIGSGSMANIRLSGETPNQKLWAICKMNMYVNRLDAARIECSNSLVNPAFVEGDRLEQFDIVVGNPPFGLEWDSDLAKEDRYGRFRWGIPPRGRADFAFISHMIECAKESSGQIVSIVPFGVLFRGGSEAEIRRKLILENLVVAVIALPPRLFHSTSIPVAILILNKGKVTRDIVFIDAEREFEAGKSLSRLRQSDLKKIVATLKGREIIDGYSYIAPVEEVGSNDYNLSVSRYIRTPIKEPRIDLEFLRNEVQDLEDDLVFSRRELDSYLGELELE